MGGTIFNLILLVQVLVGVSMIGLILIQHGKGADMGAAFGSGSAGSLFGSSGSANFLSRSTAVLATVFFITTISLSYLASHQESKAPSSVMEGVAIPAAPAPPETPAQTAPAVPAPDAKGGADEIPE